MKKWLTKFRISAALDSGSPVPEELQDAEVRRFAKTVRSLDQQLKATRLNPAAPDGLHHSIMRAVRSSEAVRREREMPTLVRWLPAAAAAIILVAGFFWAANQPAKDTQSLAAASVVLDEGQHMARTAPASLLSPLSREMEFLNRDFQNAMDFLAASVP